MKKDIEEDREGWCPSCRLCFCIDDPDVQIVQHPRNGNCLIVVEGRAHSLLMGKSWEKIKRRMGDEDHARAISRCLSPADDEAPTGELTSGEEPR